MTPTLATLPAEVDVKAPEQIPVIVSPVAPARVTAVQGGPRGAVGPEGPSGGAASAQVFTFVSEEMWSCAHGLGRLPVTIEVYDSDGMVRPLATVTNPDLNTTVVTFILPLSGKAIIA